MRAAIYLEDGTLIFGSAAGQPSETAGELVFNTAHTGYEEVLTDPSYKGQIVVFTASHIGNTGIALEDHESSGVHAQAMICKELSRFPDNYRSRLSLDAYLAEQGKTAVHGVDTRFLTRKLRDHGIMRCLISCFDFDRQSLAAKLEAHPQLSEQNLVAQVSTKKSYRLGNVGTGPTIAVLDFGVKRGILESLTQLGAHCIVLPWDTSAETIQNLDPDAIFLSNGPGDPRYLAERTRVVKELETLIPHYPTFGICLGHQLIALACGGRTEKLPFGHHAVNHPVREYRPECFAPRPTAPVQITSQNHNYAVLRDSIEKLFHLTHVHLNDRSVAGMRHRFLPVMSVQFHPEANPGPRDGIELFREFLSLAEASACMAAAG